MAWAADGYASSRFSSFLLTPPAQAYRELRLVIEQPGGTGSFDILVVVSKCQDEQTIYEHLSAGSERMHLTNGAPEGAHAVCRLTFIGRP